MTLCTYDVTTYFTPAVIQIKKVQFCKSCSNKYVNSEQAEFASILTEDNGISPALNLKEKLRNTLSTSSD